MTTKPFDEIKAAVLEDIRAHKENGVSLNPYSTHRARQSWENGFNGKQFSIMDWAGEFQRGKVASMLMGTMNEQ
jgi:hypothetical protein